MAADILAYDSDLVPVGKDQVQHVEMAQDMCGSFNAAFGDVFRRPEALVPKEEHLAKVLLIQSPEDHHLVDSVHELRRKLPPRDVKSGVEHFLVNRFQIRLVGLHTGRESDSTAQHLAHLDGAEIGGHEDHTS